MPKKSDYENLVIKKFDNSKNIKIVYEDERIFNKLTKALRQYNMFAYKDFIFNLVHQLRHGILVGYEQDDGTYRCDLDSDRIFEFVYGKIYFTYRFLDTNVIQLITMEPYDFLMAGHALQLQTYKGIPITCPKDRFKVDLCLSMEKESGNKLPKNTK